MQALTELCDLIAKNPNQYSGKVAWICKRCPPPESLLSGSPQISRFQLNAVLATARFLSKCPNYDDSCPRMTVLEFIRSIPSSFSQSFWPKSFGNASVASFYGELLGYVVKATELNTEFSTDVAGFMGGIVFAAVNDGSADLGLSRAFLTALSQNFPHIIPSDANKLVTCLLDSFLSNGSSASNGKNSIDASGIPSSGDSKGVTYFKEESMEYLEKQEIAFNLIERVLDKVQIDTKLLERVRLITKEQLRLMTAFLKIRKHDWTEQGSSLKARINTKLSVYKAAAKLKVKSHVSFDSDGKSSKKLLHGALALLAEAAEACLYSVWRRLRTCEDLFNSLLDGISKIAFTRGGHLLRVLLIRFKQLVLITCAQAETWGSSQGAMFDSVLKASCEIIEYGWTKDRAPVDTFIMGLATSIREHHDYEEKLSVQDEKKAVPVVQLNVIRLLAELNVQVNKTEVVDTILPLFIENLEEGDASTPCLLRLRILDAVSRMASLGFEKSYREVVVLMMRSYLSKLTSSGSIETNALPEEANTERIEDFK